MIFNMPKISGRYIGYARVSIDDQTLYQYEDALTKAGCERIFFEDAMTAVAEHRPELAKAEAALMPGDAFVVLAIDRAFRSTIDALLFLDRINKRGIIFWSIYQRIDTSTPEGRKWFTEAAADAEYERSVISRRTKEKMAAAKRRGQHLGRPYKLSKRKLTRAHHLVNLRGMPLSEVAQSLEVSPVTLRRGFRRLRLPGAA